MHNTVNGTRGVASTIQDDFSEVRIQLSKVLPDVQFMCAMYQ